MANTKDSYRVIAGSRAGDAGVVVGYYCSLRSAKSSKKARYDYWNWWRIEHQSAADAPWEPVQEKVATPAPSASDRTSQEARCDDAVWEIAKGLKCDKCGGTLRIKNEVLDRRCPLCGHFGAPCIDMSDEIRTELERTLNPTEEQIAEDSARVVWVATMDRKTCPDCRKLHGSEMTYARFRDAQYTGKCNGYCRCKCVPANEYTKIREPDPKKKDPEPESKSSWWRIFGS